MPWNQKLPVIVDALESILDGMDRILFPRSSGDNAKLGAKDDLKLSDFPPRIRAFEFILVSSMAIDCIAMEIL